MHHYSGQNLNHQSSSLTGGLHMHHHHPSTSEAQQDALRPVCPSQPANALHVQKLQRILDLNPFLNQLEGLMGSSIKVPADISLVANRPQNVFSVKGIWESDEERKKDVGSFYNFNSVKKRKWLKAILLEESDSESDGEQSINEQDLKALLKIHRCRRKYQKQYHADILNSQYTYYGAGLLSDHDRFPEHQKFVQEQYGFAIPSDAADPVPTTAVPVSDVDAKIQECVSDVVESMYLHENQSSVHTESLHADHIVAAVVDSAHQDALPNSVITKKKKGGISRNLSGTQSTDAGCGSFVFPFPRAENVRSIGNVELVTTTLAKTSNVVQSMNTASCVIPSGNNQEQEKQSKMTFQR